MEKIIFEKLPYKKDRVSGDNFPLLDIMRGLRIGDSKPLDTKDLVLCQKVDIESSGAENSINILRECLKPGTEILFPVTLDEGMFPYTREEIVKVVRKFYNAYKDVFLNRF